MFSLDMKSHFLFALSLFFSLVMINAGLNKFFCYLPMPPMPEGAEKLIEAFIESRWLLPLIASVELIGGILFIIPRTRALGAITLFPVVVGIFLFNLALVPDNIVVSAVLLLVNLIIIYEKRAKYMPMLQE